MIELGQGILDLLGLPSEDPTAGWVRTRFEALGIENIPDQPDDEGLPLPGVSGEGRPGIGRGLDGETLPSLPSDPLTEPQSYAELEGRAWPIAKRLAEALQLPEPDVRPSPDATRGRYSFRQDLRTTDRPYLRQGEIGWSARRVALYILVDRSGSMRSRNEEVRLALMATYLAATQLAIPTGIAFFGANEENQNLVLNVAPLSPAASESAKVLIAGYRGVAGYEFVDWGLALAEKEMGRCPAGMHRFRLVIHDGMPVYDGCLGCDFTLALERLRRLERTGYTPIGVFLGSDHPDEQLRQLLPRLVVCTAGDLPEKLGSLLRNLV